MGGGLHLADHIRQVENPHAPTYHNILYVIPAGSMYTHMASLNWLQELTALVSPSPFHINDAKLDALGTASQLLL